MSDMPAASDRKPGRRPGGQGRADSGTRAAILEAARTLFAEHGYVATSLRAIAAGAGVTPPLVIHFFGSKAGLFAEAVQWPFDPQEVIPRVAAGDPERLGERIAALFLSVWDDEQARGPILALLSAAGGDPKAAALLREFLGQELLGPITAGLGHPGSRLRANLVASQLVGAAMVRHVLRVEPLASLPADDVVALLAPTLQRYLTGDLPAG